MRQREWPPCFNCSNRIPWYFVILAILVFPFSVSKPAWAHAILIDSTPRNGAVIDGPNVKANLTFNSRIDRSRSRLTIDGPGETGAVISIEQNEQEPAKLSAQLQGLKAGLYTLHWQVLAADGHITRGVISFRVK